MAKFFYLSLLALVAFTSAQEAGQCDPSIHQQIISDCEVSCGINSCRLSSDNKPYCECAAPPARLVNGSSGEYRCSKFKEATLELLQGPYDGMECGTRCPAAAQNEESALVPYACSSADLDAEDHPVFCVCARPLPPKETSSAMRATSGDADVDQAIDDIAQALEDALDGLSALMKALLKIVLKKLGNLIKNILGKIFALLDKIDLLNR